MEGADAPYWWVVANAFNDRAEAYSVTYRTENNLRPNMQIAWHAGDVPVASDFVDIGSVGQGDQFTLPSPAAGLREERNLSIWVSGSDAKILLFRDSNGNLAYAFFFGFGGADPGNHEGPFPNTAFELNGVAGYYVRWESTDLEVEGLVYSVDLERPSVSVQEDQPDPAVLTGFIRVNGVLHDVARGQLAGVRPDNQVDRKTTDSPWGWVQLAYTAPAATGPLTELVTTQERGLRFAPPAMYYGWIERRVTPIDFSALAQSQSLQGLVPRANADRAVFVVWVSNDALGGRDCFQINIGIGESLQCGAVPFDGPDERPGRIQIGPAVKPTIGRVGQVLTITPADDPAHDADDDE